MERYTDIADGILSRPDRQVCYAYVSEEASAACDGALPPGYYWIDLPQQTVLSVTREQTRGQQVYRALTDKDMSEWPVHEAMTVFPWGLLVLCCLAQALAVVVWCTAWRDDAMLPFGMFWSTAAIWGVFGFHWFYQTEPVRGSRWALGIMAVNAAWAARLHHEDGKIAADQERYRPS